VGQDPHPSLCLPLRVLRENSGGTQLEPEVGQRPLAPHLRQHGGNGGLNHPQPTLKPNCALCIWICETMLTFCLNILRYAFTRKRSGYYLHTLIQLFLRP